MPLPNHARAARPTTRTALSTASLGGLIGVGLILLSIAFIDRPVARFMATHIQNRLPFMAMAALANIPGPLATVTLTFIVLTSWRGSAPSPNAQTWIIVAVTTLIAIMIKDQLKFDFGRVWPLTHPLPGIDNHPSYLNDHVYGFFPFHGGTSYASFPSGHTTAISAPMAALWVLKPRYRALWAALIIIVVTGLIADDFHFVSDTIAGFMLGVATAAGAITLSRPRSSE